MYDGINVMNQMFGGKSDGYMTGLVPDARWMYAGINVMNQTFGGRVIVT